MLAEKVIISNVDEVYIKVDCSDGIARQLQDSFTFQVPGFQFTPQYKARLWDGKIRLFNPITKQLYRGLVPHLIKVCENFDYEWEYNNEIYDEELSLVEANDFIKTISLTKEPRDYQLDAFVHAIRTRRSLLLSPTASGKSLIIYLILRYIHARANVGRTLIIVPTTSLVSQLASDFAEYGFDSDKYVHKIYSGQEKQSDKPIVISTWQSLFKLPKKFFQQFDAVIGDEAHGFKAKSLITIMTGLTKARYRIGTTGTLDGTKTHKLVLEGLFGPVRKVITTKELMDKKHVADMTIKCLLLKHNPSICQAAKDFTYQQEIEYLVLNDVRNKFISNLAKSLEGNTLVLYQYVDKHGKILYDMINTNADDRKVFFIYGKTDVEVREETRRIVEHERDAIIVASYGTFSTGVNIRNLHNVIFASPSKSRIRNLQSIGRSLRTSDSKTEATLYDIADDLRHKNHENYTLKHFTHRIQIYAEEKFKYKIYKIELKG